MTPQKNNSHCYFRIKKNLYYFLALRDLGKVLVNPISSLFVVLMTGKGKLVFGERFTFFTEQRVDLLTLAESTRGAAIV